MPYLSASSCGGDSLRRGAISSVCIFTLPDACIELNPNTFTGQRPSESPTICMHLYLSHGDSSNDLDGFQGHGSFEVEYLKNGAF